jgi:hypothetical protein
LLGIDQRGHLLERERPQQGNRRDDERGHEDLRTMPVLGGRDRLGPAHLPRRRDADQRQDQHAIGDIAQHIAEQER